MSCCAKKPAAVPIAKKGGSCCGGAKPKPSDPPADLHLPSLVPDKSSSDTVKDPEELTISETTGCRCCSSNASEEAPAGTHSHPRTRIHMLTWNRRRGLWSETSRTELPLCLRNVPWMLLGNVLPRLQMPGYVVYINLASFFGWPDQRGLWRYRKSENMGVFLEVYLFWYINGGVFWRYDIGFHSLVGGVSERHVKSP